MKLVSFVKDRRASYGAVTDGTIADFGAAAGPGAPDLKSAIAQGLLPTLAQVAKPAIALTSVTLLPPVPNPAKVICVQLNYDMSGKGNTERESAYPVMFTRFPDSHVGSGAPIVRPRASESFDYEGELALVIGKPAHAVIQADALGYVAGYTCYNDGSVRDWQRHTHQFTPGKNFPATGSYGPWLVTADEIPDPAALTIVTRLNGKEMQHASVGEMYFSTQELIAYISTFTPLAPGDVIATGTPAGVGFRRDPQVYLKPGDVLEVEISGIGTLRNAVVQEA